MDNPEVLSVAAAAARRHMEIVFVLMWWLQRMGAASVLATHATKRSHRPFELSLNSWHSADDSKGLARINLHNVLPAALLHRFVCVGVCVWQRKLVSTRSEYSPSVCMCIKHHTEASAALIIPCEYK